MATLLDIYHLMHSDGDLWRKVEAAALVAAVIVKYESPATPNHAARMAWADTVFADASAWTLANKVPVLENEAVLNAGHSATDEQVNTAVNALVPAAA